MDDVSYSQRAERDASDSSGFDKLQEQRKDSIPEMGHKTVLVICAHSDDEILGPGATLAKFASEGAKVLTYIMSYGEMTPMWIKHKYTQQTRKEEAEKADKIIGGSGVEFFGLKEGRFLKEAEEHGIYQRIHDIIKKEKPSIIFTHMAEDPHKDHKDTLAIVKDIVKGFKVEERPDIYAFGIWNPFQLYRRAPHLVVDVSKTFKKKRKAMECFKSQGLVILQLTPGIVVRAKFNGFMRGFSYAEVFRKVYVDG